MELNNSENKIIFTSLVGSHNYNLNTEQSDEDYKSIVIPNMEQIFSNKLANKSLTSKERDESLVDIRTFRKEILSSSPNSIEMLFSLSMDYQEGSKTIETLLSLREEIAGMNKPKLFDAYMGMAKGDKNKLEKPVHEGSSAKPYYDEHGYNTKVLVNIIRWYTTIIRYAQSGFSNYADSIFVEEDLRNAILFAKHGGFTLKEAKAMIEGLESQAKTFVKDYHSSEFNQELADKVTEMLYEELLLNLK